MSNSTISLQFLIVSAFAEGEAAGQFSVSARGLGLNKSLFTNNLCLSHVINFVILLPFRRSLLFWFVKFLSLHSEA